MKRRALRARLVLTAVSFVSAAEAEPAPAAALTAQLVCQRAAAPGRILCELTTRARSGKLVWSDALVVSAPVFARPLRSRSVAELDASGAPRASSKLALVALSTGEGTLEVLARAVVCREGTNGEWCSPEVLPLTAPIVVGPVAPR